MKSITEKLALKITAIILSYFAFVAVFISGISIIVLYDYDAYTKPRDGFKESIMSDRIGTKHVYNIYDIYTMLNPDANAKKYCDEHGIYYTVEDSESGELIEGNYSGQDYFLKQNHDWLEIYETVEYEDEYGNTYLNEKETGRVNITAYIPESALSPKGRLLLKAVDTVYTLRYTAFAVLAISATVLTVTLSFLYAAVGHRRGGVIALNHLDRIPFDLLTAAAVVAAVVSTVLISDASYGLSVIFVITLSAVLTADYFMFLGYTLTFASRLKNRTLIKNNILYMVLTLVFKYVAKLTGRIRYLLGNISEVSKAAAICGAVALFQFIVITLCMYSPFLQTVLRLLFIILDTAVIISVTIILQKIKRGGERIAAGELDYKIDTSYMSGSFKDFAESLNNINEGLSFAVNEKMKSERFKTELITNVSHDIKTPLTSIINYVDLIKKEETDNPKIKEYTEVLDRQSARLKKLTEDLVEASKAASGSISVKLTECDAGVILSQAVGEFDEKLNSAGLTAVICGTDKPIKIMADGRHLWRVFDNLMNNICKYSQSGTRVYLDISEDCGKARIAFKNISKYELNISGDELTERFVRGDRSRNTEGSGLGLSIAKSLTELQNGELKIDIDGDLFKVTLLFDAI